MSEASIGLMKANQGGWRLLVDDSFAATKGSKLYNLATYGCTEFYINGHIPAFEDSTVSAMFLRINNRPGQQLSLDKGKENFCTAHLFFINGGLCGAIGRTTPYGFDDAMFVADALSYESTTIQFGCFPASKNSDINFTLKIYGR